MDPSDTPDPLAQPIGRPPTAGMSPASDASVADLSAVPGTAVPPAAGRRAGSVIAAVATGSVVIVVIGAIVAVVLSSGLRNSPVTAAVGGAATASASVDVSPEPSTSEPDPSATPTESITASTSAFGGATAGACDPNPRVTVSVSGGNTDGAQLAFQLQSTRPGEPACANAEVYVSWVSYYYWEDGRQAMHGGAGFMVPTQTRSWTPTIDVDMGCRGDLYIVARGSGFSTLAAGVHHPFPIASASNGWTGEIASFINEPAVCTPEWPGGTSYPGPGAPAAPPPPAGSPSPSPSPSSSP